MSACSRASARTVSRSGAVGSASTTTSKQHLPGVGERSPAGVQQHGEVEEDVGGLLVDAVVGLLARRPHDLLGLLLDLLAGEVAVLEEPDDIRAVGALGRALRDRALEDRQRLVRRGRLELAAVEARARAGVARRACGLDECEDRVAVAVEPQRADSLRVARGRALVPELVARAALEVQLAGLAGATQRLVVHVREREDLARAPVLDDARHQAALVEGHVMWIEHGAIVAA
jgi:hypothetical protein